jgi:hypothetical protein
VPGSGVRCRVGVWGKDDEGESSNFKEFENVVLTVEEEAKNGTLQGASMFCSPIIQPSRQHFSKETHPVASYLI